MKAGRVLFWSVYRAWRVPFARKLMYVEALCRLLSAWLLIRMTPYSFWRGRLGTITKEPDLTSLNASEMAVASQIATLHSVLLRVFGTRFTCLMLALSARGMLRSSGIPSVLILGVNRKGTAAQATELGAHAWVKCGTFDVIGHEGSETFIPVAIYR